MSVTHSGQELRSQGCVSLDLANTHGWDSVIAAWQKMGSAMTPLKWLTFCFAIASSGPTQAVDNNLYLIVLAGQSNMVGKGDVRDLPLSFPKNGTRIWNFTNADGWELAKEPLHSNYNQVDAVSRNKHPG